MGLGFQQGAWGKRGCLITGFSSFWGKFDISNWKSWFSAPELCPCSTLWLPRRSRPPPRQAGSSEHRQPCRASLYMLCGSESLRPKAPVICMWARTRARAHTRNECLEHLHHPLQGEEDRCLRHSITHSPTYLPVELVYLTIHI